MNMKSTNHECEARYIELFRRSKVELWRKIRLSMLALVVSSVVGYLLKFDSQSEVLTIVSIVCVIVWNLALCVIMWHVYSLYRCPKCGRIPFARDAFGTRYGVEIDAKRCPNCGTRLR